MSRYEEICLDPNCDREDHWQCSARCPECGEKDYMVTLPMTRYSTLRCRKCGKRWCVGEPGDCRKYKEKGSA